MHKIINNFTSIIIAGFCFQNLSAQTVTLSAEIIWKGKDLFILNYDRVQVPYIKFTYKNNTNDSLYFYDKEILTVHDDGFLEFRHEGLLLNYGDYIPPNSADLLMDSFPDWSGREYDVFIEEFQGYLYETNTNPFPVWTVQRSDEHKVLSTLIGILGVQITVNEIDSTLQYRFFYNPNKKVISDTILDTYLEDRINKLYAELEEREKGREERDLLLQLERDSMDNNLYPKGVSERVYNLLETDILNRCIYLTPYAEYAVEFDLTPLFLLKGTYNFITDKKKISQTITVWNNYILKKTYPLDNKKSSNPKYDDRYFKYKLPKKNNGYKLYFGNINGTEVKIVFE